MNRSPLVAQELSRYGIGASEIAAACGISRWRSRYGLWLEKTGRTAPFAGNVRTRLGHLCEPRIRQLYADYRQDAVEIPTASMFHPDHPWARATPDGFVLPRSRRRGLQIKAMGYWVGVRLRYEMPPIEIVAQCQWEMFVCDLDETDLAVLIGADTLAWERLILGDLDDPAELFRDAEFEVFPIQRDEAGIRSLFDGGRRFMDLVESDREPEIDDSKECRDWVQRDAKRTGVTIDAGECPEAVETCRAAVVAEKAAELEADRARNIIRAAMTARGADRIKTTHGYITLSVDKNNQKSLRVPRGWTNPEE